MLLSVQQTYKGHFGKDFHLNKNTGEFVGG